MFTTRSVIRAWSTNVAFYPRPTLILDEDDTFENENTRNYQDYCAILPKNNSGGASESSFKTEPESSYSFDTGAGAAATANTTTSMAIANTDIYHDNSPIQPKLEPISPILSGIFDAQLLNLPPVEYEYVFVDSTGAYDSVLYSTNAQINIIESLLDPIFPPRSSSVSDGMVEPTHRLRSKRKRASSSSGSDAYEPYVTLTDVEKAFPGQSGSSYQTHAPTDQDDLFPSPKRFKSTRRVSADSNDYHLQQRPDNRSLLFDNTIVSPLAPRKINQNKPRMDIPPELLSMARFRNKARRRLSPLPQAASAPTRNGKSSGLCWLSSPLPGGRAIPSPQSSLPSLQEALDPESTSFESVSMTLPSPQMLLPSLHTLFGDKDIQWKNPKEPHTLWWDWSTGDRDVLKVMDMAALA